MKAACATLPYIRDIERSERQIENGQVKDARAALAGIRKSVAYKLIGTHSFLPFDCSENFMVSAHSRPLSARLTESQAEMGKPLKIQAFSLFHKHLQEVIRQFLSA